jgi:hypothetical protein
MIVEPHAETKPTTVSTTAAARAVRAINPVNEQSTVNQMLNSHLR